MARRDYNFAPGWLDFPALAYYTCYSVRAVRIWYERGLLKPVRVKVDGRTGDPRFYREDVDKFMLQFREDSLREIADEITTNL